MTIWKEGVATQNHYQRESIQIAKQMIHAFFIEKNVDHVLRYVNPHGFSWIGSGENEVLTDLDEIRAYFQEHCAVVTAAYRFLNEAYTIGASSNDSCIVIAKVRFQGVMERQNYQSMLHFSFYFQLIDESPLVSHYHVHIPVKKSLFEGASNFMINRNVSHQNDLIQMDLQYQRSLLNKFLSSEHIAMKSFCYEDGLPYCYVNQQFLTLVGSHNLQHFISQDKFSSLAHIHLDDQQRYLEHLKTCFPPQLKLNPAQEWQWHSSYQIVYRTRTFNKTSETVLEWGNLFTLNGHPLVNSFVLPLSGDNPPLPFGLPSQGLETCSTALSLLDDCGVNIGNLLTIYPKHQKLIIKNRIVDLTPMEFKLLLTLANDMSAPVSNEKFYDNLWADSELNVTSLTLKAHMSNLRRKLKDASDGTITISNIKNQGYVLSIPEF